jgi:hypothetical protein
VAQKFAGRSGEISRAIRDVKYAWIGDGNNMANSWIEAAGILGLDLALACPPGYDPDLAVLTRARATERGRRQGEHPAGAVDTGDDRAGDARRQCEWPSVHRGFRGHPALRDAARVRIRIAPRLDLA